MANLDTEHTNFYYEFQHYKDSNENNIRDIVIRMAMEKMLNTLETYEVKVRSYPTKNKMIAGDIKLKERAARAKGNADIEEMMDRKVDKVYERIRNDNWVIWKESIKLAEREFSEGGVKKTLDLLPRVTYDKKDLKRTINTLMHDDHEQYPRPVINVGGNSSPSKKKENKFKEEVKDSKKNNKESKDKVSAGGKRQATEDDISPNSKNKASI